MIWIYIALAIPLIFLFLFLLKEKKEYKKKLQEIERTEKLQNQIVESLQKREESLEAIEELQKIIQSRQEHIKTLETQIKEKENFNSTLFKLREDELNRLIDQEREEKIAKLQSDIDEWGKSAQQAVSFDVEERCIEYRKRIDEAQAELNNLIREVEDYRTKRDSINQEILRERAIEEKQDFYRVQIEETAQHDINVINSIRPQIYKFETLNKLIYDNYISRPAKEMVKRVLEGKNPSGIYKVTNISTKEIYIGKSTSVGDRWINHIKSACGLEGVADSQFQRALRQYGISSFTWELLEEVPKDQLTEREKYYISFYDTTHYGYNMRKG